MEGFSWRRLPKNRPADPLQQGGRKLYYSTGISMRSLPYEYLQALLLAHQGHTSIQQVPHGLKQSAYEALLQGQPLPQAIQLAAIEPDEGMHARIPREDGAVEHPSR